MKPAFPDEKVLELCGKGDNFSGFDGVFSLKRVQNLLGLSAWKGENGNSE